MKHYVLVMSGGVEIEKDGPFGSAKRQLDRAKELWRSLDATKGDNVFWLDVNVRGVVHVGAFIGGQLDEEDVG